MAVQAQRIANFERQLIVAVRDISIRVTWMAPSFKSGRWIWLGNSEKVPQEPLNRTRSLVRNRLSEVNLVHVDSMLGRTFGLRDGRCPDVETLEVRGEPLDHGIARRRFRGEDREMGVIVVRQPAAPGA